MDEITNSVRYEWLLDNPESGKHLLRLLQDGKGDKAAFTNMLNRIITSERAAKAAANA